MKSVRLSKTIKFHEGNEVTQGATKTLTNLSITGEAEVKAEDDRPIEEIYEEVKENLNKILLEQVEENYALKDALTGKG